MMRFYRIISIYYKKAKPAKFILKKTARNQSKQIQNKIFINYLIGPFCKFKQKQSADLYSSIVATILPFIKFVKELGEHPN